MQELDHPDRETHKRRALHALEQSLKHEREKWKIWENYLNCAMDLHEYHKAMTALEKIMLYKEGRFVDTRALLLLSGPVCDAAKIDKSSVLVLRYEQCLTKLSQSTASSLIKSAANAATRMTKMHVSAAA